jgi:hypothetical protein
MSEIDLTNLSDTARKELYDQLVREENEKKARIAGMREEYKKLVDEMVRESISPLKEVSSHILKAKKMVFDNFETVLKMKAEIYGTKEDQQSHTFTTTDGKISIKLGNRVNENFDDTLTSGIGKVKAYIKTLAKDADSSALVETIMDLLRMDKEGNLKASRVLELRKLANRVHNDEFSDGIRIIEESYKPVKSCQFVEVKYKDEHGKEHALPLAMSAFDL